MGHTAFAERRQHTRFDTDGMLVVVRKKGRLGRLSGMASDFNRFGLALVLDQPLPKDTVVYLNITNAELKIDNVVGVVHNCVSLETGYRCGVQFRTHSAFQEDRTEIEECLAAMEKAYAQKADQELV